MNAPRDGGRSRWAPCWAYLAPILALNYLRQALLSPGEAGDAVNVAPFAATTIVVAVVVTAVHWATAHRRSEGAGRP
jgi:hypothetical protein